LAILMLLTNLLLSIFLIFPFSSMPALHVLDGLRQLGLRCLHSRGFLLGSRLRGRSAYR
jgi:hypothetical protein